MKVKAHHVGVALCILFLVYLAGQVVRAYATTPADPHRYLLQGRDPDPWPALVVFRHCANAAEDSMAHLSMVRYVPGEKIVYRCKAHGY